VGGGVSKPTTREALAEWNAAMRREPFGVRFVWAYLITSVLWPWILLDDNSARRMPPWYQDTMIQVGDWILATWRRVKR